MTDPKLLAEQEDRRLLERIAAEDPESDASVAVQARKLALEELATHKKGSPFLPRAILALQRANTLERQVIKRYLAEPKSKDPSPPQDPPTEQNPFTDQLRHEHSADNGRPATTGTDPPTNKPDTQEDQANGVLAGARNGVAQDARVSTPHRPSS